MCIDLLRQMLQDYRKKAEKHNFVFIWFQIFWCQDTAKNSFRCYGEILRCEPLKHSEGSINLVVQRSKTVYWGVSVACPWQTHTTVATVWRPWAGNSAFCWIWKLTKIPFLSQYISGQKVVFSHGNLFLCVANCLSKFGLYVGTNSIGSLLLVSELPMQ